MYIFMFFHEKWSPCYNLSKMQIKNSSFSHLKFIFLTVSWLPSKCFVEKAKNSFITSFAFKRLFLPCLPLYNIFLLSIIQKRKGKKEWKHKNSCGRNGEEWIFKGNFNENKLRQPFGWPLAHYHYTWPLKWTFGRNSCFESKSWKVLTSQNAREFQF